MQVAGAIILAVLGWALSALLSLGQQNRDKILDVYSRLDVLETQFKEHRKYSHSKNE
jgi:hypothetical protein